VKAVTEREDDERVSLAPLDAETALRALLAVKPDDDAATDDANGEPTPNPSDVGERTTD